MRFAPVTALLALTTVAGLAMTPASAVAANTGAAPDVELDAELDTDSEDAEDPGGAKPGADPGLPPTAAWPSVPAKAPGAPPNHVGPDPGGPPVGEDGPPTDDDLPAGEDQPLPPPSPALDPAPGEGDQDPPSDVGPATSTQAAVLPTLPTPEVGHQDVEATAGSPGSDPTAGDVADPPADGTGVTITSAGFGEVAVLGVKLVESPLQDAGPAGPAGSTAPDGERSIRLLAQEPPGDDRSTLPMAALGLLVVGLAALRWRAARRQGRTTRRQASRSANPDAE